MDITPIASKGRKLIESYSRTSLKINGEKFTGSVIVFLDNVYNPKNIEEAINLIIDLKPELILTENQIVVGAMLKYNTEKMPLDAACRTFNALVAENRDVLLYAELH